jgi:phenylacetate-CoA ligase
MYSSFYKCVSLVFPGGIARYRRLHELNRSQWMSRQELRELQLRKIQRVVEHAYTNVPFYRQRFEEMGIDPSIIKTLDDFCRVPILTQQDIRTHREALVARNLPRRFIHPDATGGSTGEPLNFYVSNEFKHWNWAAAVRAESWHGHKPGYKEAWIWGADRDMPQWNWSRRLKARLKRQRWFNSFNMDEEKIEAFARMLARFQPELIVGYTSSLYLFATFLQKRNITSIRPRAVETSAEKLYDFQRRAIEQAFDCPVVDHYASRELGAIAAQCLAGGMHVFDDVRYLEVLTHGQAAKAGQVGEVVITDLTNYAMPFLRYKNGDLAIRVEQPCSCGRGLSLLQEVVGRTTDIFSTPSGKMISGLYFVHRMRGAPGIRRFQVHQTSKDSIKILVEESEERLDEAWLENRRQEFNVHVGWDTHIDFQVVDRIPATPAGKHLFTLSDVPVNLNGESIPTHDSGESLSVKS